MIQTPKLLIRKFQEQDADSLYAYLSNPVIYRYEPGDPLSREETAAVTKERSQGIDFLAVILKSTNMLIGHIYFTQTEPEEFMTWELGFIFNPDYQKKGYATEASRAVIEYGFKHFDIHRIVAHCNPENIASWRVLEKIGMTREGLLRRNVFFRRDVSGSPLWTDSYEYAMLKEDLPM
ncbi:MAG: GNAT family N-acetyltransferase [Bacteroidetes bacterium]|nr:GNAT family N-acetyltransferase [Bacteroidota bacterium]